MDNARLQCRRCGQCCSMGSMWLNSPHPVIAAIGHALLRQGALGPFCRDDGPCDMLVRDGAEATCLIHKYLGKESKPQACRDYSEDDDPCPVSQGPVVNCKSSIINS
ncbi:MAG: hypothetical protein V2A79_09870 [Planctomycetota bacterium]